MPFPPDRDTVSYTHLEALREELRRAGSPVRVCALCPGPVDTEFNKVAGVRFSLSGLSAERVAREAVDGLFAGKAVICLLYTSRCV